MNIFNNYQNKLVNKHGFDLVLIIDRSGSMEGTERNIMMGHQKMVNYLKNAGKKITLTTILFDDDIVIACDGKHITEIKKLSYYTRGCTALYDAWGAAIIHENNRKKDKNNPYPNADVLYLTVTDGEENSSSIYDMEKIRKLMTQERHRSIEGRGIREFATITEFGIDTNDYEKQLNIGKNNSQIFYRGDEGISVLFKVVELAAENMLEYRRITEKWIKKSDQLKIGSYTLGQIKKMTAKPQRALANLEKIYMELLLKADSGLTDDFWKEYHKYEDLVRKIDGSGNLKIENKEVDSILDLYIGKNKTNLRYALERAKDATVDKAASSVEICLGKIREAAENKETAANEFYSAVNLYKKYADKLDHLPAYFQLLKTREIADNISYLLARFNKRYIEIVSKAFNKRTDALKIAFGTGNKKTFDRLEKFAQEPFASLFKDIPSYVDFCGWMETFQKEIKKAQAA